jgi:hypothetical protein
MYDASYLFARKYKNFTLDIRTSRAANPDKRFALSG